MATEYAAPFAASTIATSQQYRDRYRPTQMDMVDDNYGGTSLAVTNAANVNVNVANGDAIIQGARYSLTAGPAVLAVAANGGGSNRFDIVCLTYDAAHSPGVYARIVQGTAGAGLPALTRSLTGVWDFPLAHYEKQPGGNIVNMVDRRVFSDGAGGIIGATSAWAPLAPNRIGAPFFDSSTGRTYKWDGAAWGEENYWSTSGWDAYTPLWTSSGTAPVVGNGSIAGKYKLSYGRTMHIVMRLTLGTTSTVGTGTYSFSLPSWATARTTNPGQYLTCRTYDQSANQAWPGIAYVNATTVVMQTASSTSVLATNSATYPVVPANLDEFAIWGTIELA